MMLISKNIFKILKKKKIDFYTGVPDSVLKSFSTNLKNLSKKEFGKKSQNGPDGLKIDKNDNVYLTIACGVHVFDSEG